jgi:hypothetical protein
VSQIPKANATAHKGDKVTVTLGGWARDDIKLMVDSTKIKLKVGEKKTFKVRASENVPDEFSFCNCCDEECIKFEWGELIDDKECEFSVTALKAFKHELIVLSIVKDEKYYDELGKTITGKEKANDIVFNFQATAIGVEAGGSHVRAFTEFGIGEQGIALAGVRFKF